MSNFNKFKRELMAAVDESIAASEKTIRAAAIQTFRDIIIATPVGNPTHWQSPPPRGYSGGTLRANWQTTLNSPATGTVNKRQKGNAGAATQETLSNTKNYKLNNKIYLTNNLPYAERINEGFSVQPGAEIKFVEKNVAKFNRTLERIARKNQT